MKLYAAVSEYGDIHISMIRWTKQEVLDAMVARHPDALTNPGGTRVIEFDDGDTNPLVEALKKVMGGSEPLKVVVKDGVKETQVWP